MTTIPKRRWTAALLAAIVLFAWVASPLSAQQATTPPVAEAPTPAKDAGPTTPAAQAPPTTAEGRTPPATAEAPAPTTAAGHVDQPWYFELLNSGAMGFMIRGGFFMWPILGMAILAAGVTIERWRTLRLLDVDTSELRSKVLALLQADRGEAALELCLNSQGPVPAVLAAGIRHYLVLKQLRYDVARIEDQVVKAMEDYSVHVVAGLERHLPTLATISSVAPMVGSVGTVWGMIVLFNDIVDQFGTTNIIMAAAKGIQLKLLVTVWGLIVGIPAYVAFNYFTTVINRYVLNIEQSATELMETVTLQMALREGGANPSLANHDGAKPREIAQPASLG